MRKAQAKKLPLAPDPRFNDKLVTRFVNNLMWEGKKSGAFIIFYDALDKVAKQTNEDGYEVWKTLQYLVLSLWQLVLVFRIFQKVLLFLCR